MDQYLIVGLAAMP